MPFTRLYHDDHPRAYRDNPSIYFKLCLTFQDNIIFMIGMFVPHLAFRNGR